MSLTLPYPSLVFVPLDVLTADEMNQIVANYEFISDQFPIGSDNIDSTTLRKLAYLPSDTITANGAYCFAMLGSQTSIRVSIPLNKSLDYVTGATVKLAGTAGDYVFCSNLGSAEVWVNSSMLGVDIIADVQTNQIRFDLTVQNLQSSSAYANGVGNLNNLKITFV